MSQPAKAFVVPKDIKDKMSLLSTQDVSSAEELVNLLDLEYESFKDFVDRKNLGSNEQAIEVLSYLERKEKGETLVDQSSDSEVRDQPLKLWVESKIPKESPLSTSRKTQFGSAKRSNRSLNTYARYRILKKPRKILVSFSYTKPELQHSMFAFTQFLVIAADVTSDEFPRHRVGDKSGLIRRIAKLFKNLESNEIEIISTNDSMPVIVSAIKRLIDNYIGLTLRVSIDGKIYTWRGTGNAKASKKHIEQALVGIRKIDQENEAT